MYTFANRVMLIRRYVLHQDESLNAKILKKHAFILYFFWPMFSVSFENENITSKPFTYIGKNEGATALFFSL